MNKRFISVVVKMRQNYFAVTMAGAIARGTRSVGKLVANNTALFVCDLQEKFRNNIQYFPEIVENSSRLLKAFKVLDLPVICTEQYPKGLGHTVAELKLEEHGVMAVSKTQFSMCIPPIQELITEKDIKSIVICGIEAHVCVQQTTLDLITSGKDVHVVADAVSSRSQTDRLFALKRMQAAGAFLTTSESAILGLPQGSHHPKFRELQKIIWESAPDTGLSIS